MASALFRKDITPKEIQKGGGWRKLKGRGMSELPEHIKDISLENKLQGL